MGTVADREKNRRYQREWARRRRDGDAAYRRRGADQAREWQRRNPIRNAWNQYRSGARIRGLVFKLTQTEFDSLILADCRYCGEPANPVNGIDRVDSSAGYTADNVTTACKRCNLAKRDATQVEFLTWIRRLIDYQGGLG